MDWTDATPPDAADFEQMARAAIAALPAPYRAAAEEIVLRIEDFAPDAMLKEMEIGDAFELTGLYDGIPLHDRGSDYVGELPDTVHIFRQPHLAMGLPEDELRAEIEKTVLHELAHYFGLDDDHLDEIGWG